ncbi:hypothetical protein ACGFYQ_36600 [Streptomyces sp. NPDC048258]|uniref:hypothetical protein n=1 Tax=Streptomyces sp. NPDC048258 TaxID=3365527 RepID=UPI003717B076
MASIRTLAPLMIAPLLAAGAISLTTTAHAAPTTTTGVTTEDKPRPGTGLLTGLSKVGALTKIGPNTAAGGDTEPPAIPNVYKIGRISVIKRVDIPKGSDPIMTDETHEGGGGNVAPPDPGGSTGGVPSPKPEPEPGTDDRGPRQDSDYAVWTDPNPGPVVH